ncbi:MAG: DNA primase, partial [Cyanobium sp.]
RLLWACIGEIEEEQLGSQQLEAINRGLDSGQPLALLSLSRLLNDRLLLEDADLARRLTPLLEPSELQRITLAQPQLQLRGATASLERLRCLRRCKHLLEAWKAQRLVTIESCLARLMAALDGQDPAGSIVTPAETQPQSAPQDAALDAAAMQTPPLDMEQRIEALFAQLNVDALRYQEAYYSERHYLEQLDQQRCAGYELGAALPAA